MAGERRLPDGPPFTLRAAMLTPVTAGGVRHLLDARIEVDADGRLTRADEWRADAVVDPRDDEHVVDVRPWVVLPGLVDLHMHLPQLPNAGIGAGLDLLPWLERYIFPLERRFDCASAELLVPQALRALAAAGTTTVVAYAALWEDSTHACFEAAEAHGIRAVIGKVMMDRVTYDDRTRPTRTLEQSVRESVAVCERWHGRDDGRLSYAFTPRFAVSCSAAMLRESARLAGEYGAYWQTHVSEDLDEVAEVRRLFPQARDYLDVYERAGGLEQRAILAHAIHLSDDEVTRLAASGAGVAHCPSSNLFLSSGAMPAARYVSEGIHVGLGSDVAGGPELSILRVARAAAETQRHLELSGRLAAPAPLDTLDWLRMATLGGAAVLGIDDRIGSVEVGKEADIVLVDPGTTAPVPDAPDPTTPDELVSRLLFRTHPDLVRAAWVRGRRLPG